LATDYTDSLRENADLCGFFFTKNVLVGARFDFAQRDKRETQNMKLETIKTETEN
jgi:hypothetical protein